MKFRLISLTLFLSFIPALTFSQANRTESLSVATYYPSPNAVFDRMEVKNKLVVGDISVSNSAVNKIYNVSDVQPGQVFVTNSIILGSQNAPTAPFRDGQIFFNNSTGVNKLEFFNGSWQRLGS